MMMAGDRSSSRVRRVAIHAARVGLLVTIIALIHDQHQRRGSRPEDRRATHLPIQRVRALFPEAVSVSEAQPGHGGRQVLGPAGQTLGHVVQTSPDANDIIGFSGPTNTLIAFDLNQRILGIDILSSGDTRDHVQQVRQDTRFGRSLNGLTWDEASKRTDADAVTGATLTSLAIQESIIRRLGGAKPSLRFPNPLTLDDARTLFPEAIKAEQDDKHACLWHVKGANGIELGTILRTSPAADHIIGYQGPTDALIAFDGDDRVVGASVGQSYDNQPYVSYVRDDATFLLLFNGLQRQSLAELDLVQAQIEGVSGATMTSTAVAEAIVRAASEFQQSITSAHEPVTRPVTIGLRDAGTMAVVLAATVFGLTSLKSRRFSRVTFQLLLVGYLGIVNGDLISQAMLVGWAQHGVPWQSAMGLVFLTGAALMLTITTRRNLYCSHMCPHGAAQQLLKNRLPWRARVPRRLLRVLTTIPAVLLVWCVVVAMTALPFSLVDIEPFDAWVFRVAGWATVTIAVVGLVASLFVPMAYCRLGCPTGALLNYLRFHSRSDRWTRRDWLVVGIVAMAIGLRVA